MKSGRARSLFLAPPQPCSSSRLRHRAGNTRVRSTLDRNYLQTSVPSGFWSQAPHRKRPILTQEESRALPGKSAQRLRSVFVPRNFISPIGSSGSAHLTPTRVARPWRFCSLLRQVPGLGACAGAGADAKSPRAQVSFCFLQPSLSCGFYPGGRKWPIHLRARPFQVGRG